MQSRKTRLDELTKEREWKSNLAIPFRGVSGFRVEIFHEETVDELRV